MTRGLLIFFSVLFLQVGFAQSYHFVHLKADDEGLGLTHNSVYDLIQDKRGGLWFATQAGVTYYNGIDFKFYKEENGLSNDIVYTLYEDSKGNIWMGTYDGLTVYDGAQFRTYNKEKNNLPSNVVKSIHESADGTIWVGTEGSSSLKSGICYLPNYQTPDSVKFLPLETGGLNIGRTFRKILETSDGKMWFGGDRGVAIYNNGDIKHLNTSDGLIGKDVQDIIQASNGDVWIATSSGISVFDGQTFYKSYSVANGLPTDAIKCLKEDQDDNIWIGTSNKGVLRYNVHEEKFKLYNSKKGLSEDIVECILEDASLNIWVGTKGGGVNKFSGVAFTYFGQKEGLASEKINGLIQASDESFWYATREGAINYDGKDFRVYDKAAGLNVNYVNCVFEDRDENIWLGTLSGIAKITDGEIVANYSVKEGIFSPISCIFEDSKNNMWFGTDGGGLFKFDGKNFSNYTMIHGMNNSKITSIIEDNENTLWIGTFGGGVNRFAGNEFIHYTKDDGLSANIVYCLTIGPRGAIYIGTKNGITKWVSATEIYEFSIKSEKNSLSSNNIKMMIFDEDNSLWVGTEKGLDRVYFNPPQIFRQTNEAISEIKHYGKKEGIKGGEINRNASCEDEDGNLWFGTNNGAIKFNIEVDEYNSSEPQTYITNVNYGNHAESFWAESNYKLKPWTNLPENLILPPDVRAIKFDFIGIDLKSPEKVKYTLRLYEDGNLIDSSSTLNNYKEYNQLSPGKYKLVIVSCNSDDVCSDPKNEHSTYEFEVEPPFYQTRFFIGLLVFIGIVSIYLFIKVREKKLKRERLILERKIKERTQEVVDKNKELELVNLEIISKNFEIENKNADLNSSIRYALTIQKASFPSISELTEIFDDSFIYHIPRDIVSGDFYWYKKTGNKFVLAIADCTGHGVPGALTSMIGIALLNEIVGGNKITDPAIILNKLDHGILKAFENSESESNDGMDIGLVTFDLENKILEYSGAYRPLIHVRNGELVEHKATKMSIGFKDVVNKEFEKTTIEWQSGDCIYLYSDGYADQFGGPNNKKFKTKIMKEMLLNSSSMTMEQQKEIVDERFITWMGPSEQVDDILVCGIKFS